MFKLASLFSGAGGLDWGFKETGFQVVFANDVLYAPMRTFSRNFGLKLNTCSRKSHVATPGEALVCDITRVDFTELSKLGVDVVTGGPPCQDFSIIKENRRGIEVERGRLYTQFVRALAEIKPRVFVFENVPGLVSANRGLAYKTIISDFARAGYEPVFTGVVDFSKHGVPQKRRRLIIVGVRKDLFRNHRELVETRKMVARTLHGERVFEKYPLTTIEVFEGRVLPDLQNEYVGIMKRWEGVWLEVNTQRAYAWKRKVWDKHTFDVVKDYLLVNGVKACNEHELEEAWREHERVLRELGYYGRRVCKTPPPDGTCTPQNTTLEVVERLKLIPPGENYSFVEGTVWGIKPFASQYYRRIHPLKPSYTIIAHGSGGMYCYHYDRNRTVLSLREKARIQTFPDDFLFYGSRTEVKSQIGEAVPPLVSKRIAEVCKNVLKEL